MDRSPHESGFVDVNGIRLHYLDWGGSGDVLLFLAGMGCNAHIFDHIAPRFTDIVHAMALTRRGHGESDHPETGYDIDALTEDICQFLDAAYDRASAAYKEVVEKSPWKTMQPPGLDVDYYSAEDYFAATKRAYPSFGMIWTEAMQEQSLHEITTTPDGKIVDRMSDAIGKALQGTMTSYILEDSRIRSPVLAFYAFSKGLNTISEDWMTEEQKSELRHHVETREDTWTRDCIEKFRRNVPQARIIEILHGHHYCFIRDEELVYEEMRKFLLGS